MIYKNAKYLLCGDRFMVVEYGDEGSLQMSYKVLGMKTLIDRDHIEGTLELCPGSASLMVSYDPSVIKINRLVARLKGYEEKASGSSINIPSRIIKIPIWYNDPSTNECAREFGVRNNIEWAAEINKMGVDEFIKIHSSATYMVTSIGFSPGSPAFLSIDPDRELVGPKYKPRTWTPRGTLGLGGNSNIIYAMKGPGGVSMLGVTPLLLYDIAQRNPVFKEDPILFRPGDRIAFVLIGKEEFEEISRNIRDYSYDIVQGEPLTIDL